MRKIYFLVLLTSSILSCNNQNKTIKKKEVKNLKYAKGFSISEENGLKKITITNAYKNADKHYEYLLVPKEKVAPTTTKNIQIIRTPVQKIIVTSTSHIPLLEFLEKENTLVGFPNISFVSSNKTRKLIDTKKVLEIGKEEDLNTEILLDLKPELILSFAVEKPNKSFSTIQKTGIPILLNGDWLEETPLGRAEWIKIFGAVFEEEKKADSIFNDIEKEYNKAKEIVKKYGKSKPTILSGSMFQDVWYLPAGESFMATFFKDAQTNYLWKNSKGTGSLPLNFENVYDKAQNADFWIGCNTYETKNQLENETSHYTQFSAYKNNRIYTFSKFKGTTGGIFFYELGPIRPDIILKDIIKITHPELLPNHIPIFFQQIQ